MGLTTSEKVKIILKRRKMTMGDLSNKMSRDNFSEKEIRELAAALDCEYEMHLVMKDTGEKI